MICALCGTEFDETDHDCAAGCPIAGVQGCTLVCCPHCGYQTVDENRSALVRGLRKLIARRTAPEPRGVPGTRGESAARGPAGAPADHAAPAGDDPHGEPRP